MKKLTTNQIRAMWIDFFKQKNHHLLPSASLVPVNDPSLLWINSGVATLKPYFDGRQNPPAPRLVNAQKALRTNDIENVGVTARHQTMFEMLGNFSIGDYFKREAIEFAWELLTSKDWFALDPNKLYITVFDEDLEAYDVWTRVIKVPKDHIFQLGRETNFWDVGQGPCGPNSEIFFDRGEEWDPIKIGTRLLSEDMENDRYIEIWNIVFSQFNNDGNNNYTDLPRKNIDTGAGLERLASLFQNTPTNFETDLFWPTIQATEKLSGKFKYQKANPFALDPEQTKVNTAFKVIADHVRAVSFAISDGVFPSNKDRGYVLRRLIRRGSVYGRKLGINEAFLYKLVPNVIEAMGEFYPVLKEKQKLITKTIQDEEVKFLATLSKGYEMLMNLISKNKEVTAQNAMLLFESFGFPVELTQELVEEQGLSFDKAAYRHLLDEAKAQSRLARKDLKAWNNQNELFTNLAVDSEFIGWQTTTNEHAKVVYLFVDEHEVNKVNGGTAYLILDRTPFYAEKGGQAADHGHLILANGTKVYVTDVQQGPNGQHIHQVELGKNTLTVGDVVYAQVELEKRILTMKNHSGTHLLHAALREVLGKSVMQSGSYNDEHGLRMDFSYDKKINPAQLQAVQNLVQEKIQEGINREVYFTNIKEAVDKYHALAFFTEKYDETVRVVKFGDFSSELCGGTHVENTSEVEDLLITGIESKGSGVYRVKALTSYETVMDYLQTQIEHLQNEANFDYEKYRSHGKLLVNQDLEAKFEQLQKIGVSKENYGWAKIILGEFKDLFKQWDRQIQVILTNQKLSGFKNITPVLNEKGFNEISLTVKDLNINELKTLADEFRNKFSDLIVVLRSKSGKDNFMVVAVSESLQKDYSALEIFKNQLERPRGGGNKNLAQGKY